MIQEYHKRPPSFTSEQFTRLDKSRDGKISREELLAALSSESGVSTAAANAWADYVIREFDVSHTGFLDLHEFTAFANSHVAHLHTTFHDLDASHTGSLNKSDIRAALIAANVSHLDADVDALLHKLGATGGTVTWEQFLQASFVLPNLSSQECVLTLTGNMPLRKPPPGTTPLMLVLAGFINGAVSRTATAPFDRLRAVLATGRETSVLSAARNMYKAQGIRGFWASNLANVVQVGPENAIGFTLNSLIKEKICSDVHNQTLSEKFIGGSVAGAIAMTAVYPMYVIQGRLAAAAPGQYNGMIDCARRTFSGGMRSAYGGFTVSLIRVVPLKGIMLGGYSALKDLAKDPETGEISTPRSLACSATSGAAAHVLTYPMHLARTVLQQEVPSGGRQYSGFIEVLRDRFSTRGIRGCYAGLPIWLCNRVPAVAIEFAVNERALNALKTLSASS